MTGFDGLPKMVHRPKLPYTEAVLHESMRLSSVIPTGTLHVSACDTTVGKLTDWWVHFASEFHCCYFCTCVSPPICVTLILIFDLCVSKKIYL